MADIRINALATTAASTASDDFVAVDGSANGTRKLNAYSPTFGGNLTVSGTGGFGGSTGPHTFGNGGGAVEVRAVGDSSGYYGYALYTGGSYESSLKHSASTAITKLDVGRNSAWGGTFEIYADTTRAARFAKTSTTLDGNLTVSGTGTSSVATTTGFTFGTVPTAGFKVGAIGTGGSFMVQTPSLSDNFGSGLGIDGTYSGGKSVINLKAFGVYSGGPYSADLAFHTSSTTTLTEQMRLNSAGNLLIGTTTDGGQKLQVAGTGYLSDSLRVGTSFTPVAWGVKAIEVNDAGGGLFAVYYGGAAKGYLLAESGGISLTAQGSGAVRLNAGTGNFLFGSSASAGTSAVGVLAIANATAPTSSPAGGGQLYVESGALKYRGSSGTVTTIANA